MEQRQPMEDQMAHYTKLPATGQLWRLILFKGDECWGRDSRIRRLAKTVGIMLGFYFLGGGRRSVGDVIAVGFYLLGVVPLFGIALLEIGLLARGRVEDKKIWLHAAFVVMFLAVAHVATPRSMTRAPASITLNGPQVDPSRNRPYSGQTLPSLLDYLAWEA